MRINTIKVEFRRNRPVGWDGRKTGTVDDNNIAITEITYLQQAATDVLYIIVDETHPLFNLNLFLTNIVYDTPDELTDEAHSELNDMLQALIESYRVDLNKR